jgi:hypothetical protein
MKYKVGDKVILTNGDTMTVYQINDTLKWYFMKEDPLNCYTDEMIEGLVEEETKNWADTNIPDGPYTVTYDSPSMNDSMNKNNIHNEIILPNGYIFKDENGNVINATKIVLEKKKNEYPKTYKECCKIFGLNHYLGLSWNSYDEYSGVITGLPKRIDDIAKKLESLSKLIICRDAYWKIAGEEMGLGKPWEPDFTNDDEERYGIYTAANKVVKDFCGVGDVNTILTFPTEEMRDAFYENFKELIESVKELL